MTRAERKKIRRTASCREMGCPVTMNDGEINKYYQAWRAQRAAAKARGPR